MELKENLQINLYLNNKEYNLYSKTKIDLPLVVNRFSQDEYIIELMCLDSYLVCVNDSKKVEFIYNDISLLPEIFKTIMFYNLNISSIDTKYDIYYKEVFKPSYKKFLVSGGCFWCINYAFSDLSGVVVVRSGYCGGSEFNPTYQETKSGLNHHKETILVIYDSDVISYNELIEVYFNSIDPFDPDGQFIDKGLMYTCAVYTNDRNEIEVCKSKIAQLERAYNKKVYVSLDCDKLIYNAEDYHQDYHKKNFEAFMQEMKESKRIKE